MGHYSPQQSTAGGRRCHLPSRQHCHYRRLPHLKQPDDLFIQFGHVRPPYDLPFCRRYILQAMLTHCVVASGAFFVIPLEVYSRQSIGRCVYSRQSIRIPPINQGCFYSRKSIRRCVYPRQSTKDVSTPINQSGMFGSRHSINHSEKVYSRESINEYSTSVNQQRMFFPRQSINQSINQY